MERSLPVTPREGLWPDHIFTEARWFYGFSLFEYAICMGFKIIFRSACYTRGF